MLEVLDVVLEVYHTQHIFKYTMCVFLEVVDVLEVLPYATHFQTCCVGGKTCCVGGLPYTTHFQNMLCVITFYNRNVSCTYCKVVINHLFFKNFSKLFYLYKSTALIKEGVFIIRAY